MIAGTRPALWNATFSRSNMTSLLAQQSIGKNILTRQKPACTRKKKKKKDIKQRLMIDTSYTIYIYSNQKLK